MLSNVIKTTNMLTENKNYTEKESQNNLLGVLRASTDTINHNTQEELKNHFEKGDIEINNLKNDDDLSRISLSKSKGIKRKSLNPITEIKNCIHVYKAHHAKGMCRHCYQKYYFKKMCKQGHIVPEKLDNEGEKREKKIDDLRSSYKKTLEGVLSSRPTRRSRRDMERNCGD